MRQVIRLISFLCILALLGLGSCSINSPSQPPGQPPNTPLAASSPTISSAGSDLPTGTVMPGGVGAVAPAPPTATYTPAGIPVTPLFQTANGLPGGLRLEETELESAPLLDPLTFIPVRRSFAEVLAQHRADRQENFPDRSFFDKGHYAISAMGDDKLTAMEIYTNTGSSSQVGIEVFRGRKIIFRIPAGESSPVQALRGLWAYDGHWILEIAYVTLKHLSENEIATQVVGQVVQDKEPLNERYGYQEVFAFQLLHGKPFYFFQRDGQIGVSYDGHEAMLGYSQVPHYGCCSGAELNPVNAQNMVAFFAQRDGRWYYVELGVFQDQ